MKHAFPNNVFSGPTALRDLFNPDRQPPLPLVELPPSLNPMAADGVRIYAKLMNFLPLANSKSLPALNMFLEKEASGGLEAISTLIENSSGNTAFSLGVLARLFGIERTKAIVSHEVSRGKIQLLRFFGVDLLVNEEPICPDPNDKDSGIHKARAIGETELGWWNPGQYDNMANPSAHERWTGPQIWEQTNGNLSVFCAGLGTTGTMVGAGGYLKRQAASLRNVGVIRKPNNPVPGVRTRHLLREIAFNWNACVDAVIEVGTRESFEQSLRLCRQGLLVGPSSGFALAGLVRFLQSEKDLGRIDALENKEGEIVAVFICPDSPFPYIDEYFDHLDARWFAPIENRHLLRNDVPDPHTSNHSPDVQAAEAADVRPEEAFSRLYAVPPEEAWRILNAGGTVPLRDRVRLLDLRDPSAFNHAHLPGAEHIDYKDALEFIQEKSRAWPSDSVYVICAQGNRSRVIAGLLAACNISAFSIHGGMLEWSRENLPRWRPEACRFNHATPYPKKTC